MATEAKVNGSNSNQIAVSLCSGAGAGFICTILCAPLDTAKVRLQVQGSLGLQKYSGGTLSVLRTIYSDEGVRGIFRGVGPALLTVPLFWSVYWPIYDRAKVSFRDNYPDLSPPLAHLSAAVSAGVVGDLITNPFWVARTRIQTLILHPEMRVISMSTFEMIRKIYQNEGFTALYKGLGASFLGLSHVAIQFPLYEHLKKLSRSRRADNKESLLDILASSITAKLVASTITYPHEVLRARLQDARATAPNGRTSLWRTLHGIVQNEGFWSLWSGLRVGLVRIIPATITTFVSYEYISRYLKMALQEEEFDAATEAM